MLNNLTKLLAKSNSSIVNTQTVVYNFKNNNNKFQRNNIFTILNFFFAAYSCLISRPVWTITPNKIILHLCYYQPKLDSKKKNRKGRRFRYRLRRRNLKLIPSSNLRSLVLLLSEILQTEVELDLVLLKYPYHDSYILAQLLGLNSKRYNFNRLVKKLFNKATIFKKVSSEEVAGVTDTPLLRVNSVPSKLTGIKVKIAGRLTTQRIVPKATVKTAYKGSFVRSKNNYVVSSTYTAKNKIGAYTVRVYLSNKII
jgi:hypothetical protein